MTTDDTPKGSGIKKSGFAGDVLKLVSGTTFAQALAILVAPVLTRIYAPEAFGILALFVSITSIFAVIAGMRYELAIMLPKHDEEAANLLGVSLGFSLLISLLMVPLIFWGRTPLLRWLNAPGLACYLWLVPLVVLIRGVFISLSYWNSRTKHFGRLSIASVTSSLTNVILSLGLGFSGHATAGSMVGASIAGQTAATSVLGGKIWRDDRRLFLKSIRWRAMWAGMKRHKKFPLISTCSALMNTFSVQLPPLLLATFFSSATVGFYALGHRLLSIPMNLIGSAISQVFFQRAAVAKTDGTLPSVVRMTFMRLAALGSFPILLIMITGKDIFSVIFGNQWTEAGIYAQILAPWILFVFMGSPISTLFSILEMQGSGFLFNSVLLITRIASLVTGGLAKSIFVALSLYSGSGMILWILFSVYLLKKVGLTIQMMARDTFEIIIVSLIVLLPLIALKIYSIEPLYTVIAGCLSAILYYTILYFRDKELRKLVDIYAGMLFHRI